MRFTEQEMERGDYLHDEMRDRQIEAAMERDKVADILRNSMPKAAEPAPPVPQRLADEIAANFMRSIPSARPPRFFRETSTGLTWEFRNGRMTFDGEDSIFKSPEEILEALDIVEVDEHGNALELAASDIAAERGDREQQRKADES